MSYLVHAGYEQFHMLWGRRPIAEVLADPSVEESVKEKITHVQKVRSFSVERLGLTLSGSFTSYTKIDREAVSWSVTASQKLKLKPRTWWFPVVGRVPYLGFFSKEEAEEEAARLERQNWDTLVSEIPAYSLLGWFDDPLYSSQLSLPLWFLTELVIHEGVHSTLWFPGDVRFNESFASFVADKGVTQFYAEKYGTNSVQYQEWMRVREEKKLVQQIFLRYSANLNRLFQSDRSDEEKYREKERSIAAMKSELKRLARCRDSRRLERLSGRRFNNANFLSYRRYGSGEPYFEKVFQESGKQWDVFLRKMRSLQELAAEKRRERVMGKIYTPMEKVTNGCGNG